MDLASAGPIVLHTLTSACSQNADILKPAVHQLKQWETSPGFYTILSVSIFLTNTNNLYAFSFILGCCIFLSTFK